jgi:hypothetical protein
MPAIRFPPISPFEWVAANWTLQTINSNLNPQWDEVVLVPLRIRKEEVGAVHILLVVRFPFLCGSFGLFCEGAGDHPGGRAGICAGDSRALIGSMTRCMTTMRRRRMT